MAARQTRGAQPAADHRGGGGGVCVSKLRPGTWSLGGRVAAGGVQWGHRALRRGAEFDCRGLGSPPPSWSAGHRPCWPTSQGLCVCLGRGPAVSVDEALAPRRPRWVEGQAEGPGLSLPPCDLCTLGT